MKLNRKNPIPAGGLAMISRLLPPKARKLVLVGGIGYVAIGSLLVLYRTNEAFKSRVDYAAANGAVWAIRIAAAKCADENWKAIFANVTPEQLLAAYRNAKDGSGDFMPVVPSDVSILNDGIVPVQDIKGGHEI